MPRNAVEEINVESNRSYVMTSAAAVEAETPP
jgi:hypothetical protein